MDIKCALIKLDKSRKENDSSNARPWTTTVLNAFIPYQSSKQSRGVAARFERMMKT